ncbi:MAG: DUF86 domain-containing protein [Chlamydiales bacterium]
MLEAAHVCLEFVDKKKRKDFENDKMLGFATIRALEIFGEAAANISKSFQQKHPQIEWRAIIGMRNRLIHAYFNIDYDIVWQALKSEIPKIIPELEKLINNLEKEIG